MAHEIRSEGRTATAGGGRHQAGRMLFRSPEMRFASCGFEQYPRCLCRSGIAINLNSTTYIILLLN